MTSLFSSPSSDTQFVCQVLLFPGLLVTWGWSFFYLQFHPFPNSSMIPHYLQNQIEIPWHCIQGHLRLRTSFLNLFCILILQVFCLYFRNTKQFLPLKHATQTLVFLSLLLQSLLLGVSFSLLFQQVSIHFMKSELRYYLLNIFYSTKLAMMPSVSRSYSPHPIGFIT